LEKAEQHRVKGLIWRHKRRQENFKEFSQATPFTPKSKPTFEFASILLQSQEKLPYTSGGYRQVLKASCRAVRVAWILAISEPSNNENTDLGAQLGGEDAREGLPYQWR